MAFKLKSNIDPKQLAVRPLKGMVRDISSTLIAPEQFYTVENFYPERSGLRKRNGYGYYSGGYAVDSDDQPIITVAPVWKTGGQQFAALLTSRYLYSISGYAQPAAAYWVYTTGYVSVSGTTVTGYGTEWDDATQYLYAGDYIVLDADGSGDGPEEIKIASIDDHNTITLDSTPTGTYTVTEHVEYGNCEDANSPTLYNGVTGPLDATWARSAVQVKGGTYSWVLTKTAAGGVDPGRVYLSDNADTTDMHGLSAGATYYMSLWMFSDVGTGANASVTLREYYSGSWHDAQKFTVSAASTWELKSTLVTLNGSATGARIRVLIDTAEDAGKVLYIDDLSLLETAGVDYAIRRRFQIESTYLLDWTVLDNKLVIADHTRPLYSYDGSSFGMYDAGVTYVAGCVTFFADRLWLGNTIESGLHYKHRIRWSSPTDHTSFNAAHYLDLPYSTGELRRLVPLGNLLVAYFSDAIYVGRPSNLQNLPYSFSQVNSGKIGLVGSRTVAEVQNGHVFIGQGDVYFLSTGGLTPLECPIADDMLSCSSFDHAYVVADPNNDRIVFGLPEGGGTYISKLYMYNLTTKQWSYENVSATSISNPMLDLGLTWEDLANVISQDDWDVGMGDFSSWESISGGLNQNVLFRSDNGYLYQVVDGSGSDVGIPITALFVTGDWDLKHPDTDKTFMRFSLKVKDVSEDVSINIHYSLDMGNTWTYAGVITVTTTVDEGKVDFIATGTTIRFRCTMNSSATYTIVEMGLRYRHRGLEIEYS